MTKALRIMLATPLALVGLALIGSGALIMAVVQGISGEKVCPLPIRLWFAEVLTGSWWA